MRTSLAFLLLCTSTLAAEPSIVGPKSVKVGQPPWVSLSVDGAEAGSITRWSGAIGPGLVGMESKDGVAVSTAVPGRYAFRCIVQTPKEGIDPIVVLDTVLVVEGDGVVPPDVVPTVDWQQRLTAAVKAAPDKHAGFAKVAGVYGLVADQIKGGLLTSPDQVTKMTQLLCSAASPEWAAIDAAIVQPHLKTLTLKLSDYEPLWRQIQAAIKAGLTDIPPPDVVPVPTTTLHVLIVEEMDSRGELPASQVSIFTSTDLRKWLTENKAQWRIFDRDVPQEQLADVWKSGLKKVSESGLQLPVVLVSNGAKGTIEKLPASVDELKTLLEKYR
jgi:hypothetical protein